MTIYGVDLSDFDSDRGNSPATVAKYRAAGISFLTHKATETTPGTVFKHINLGRMLTAGRDSGIPFLGAYVVPRSGVAIGTQGANYIAFLDAQVPWWRSFPGFFHQVDLEQWSYDAVAASVGNQLFDWLRANGGGKPVVEYGSKGQYPSSALRSPRWNANYPINTAMDFKALYAASGGDSGPGWQSYGNPARVAEIWQYASVGIVAGRGTTDVNAFRGTETQFAAALGFSVAPATGGSKLLYFVRVQDGPQIGALIVSDGVSRSYFATEAACRAAMARAGKSYGQWDAQPTQAQLDAGEWGTPVTATLTVDAPVAEIAQAVVALLPSTNLTKADVTDALKSVFAAIGTN